jgi:hypothetical protein
MGANSVIHALHSKNLGPSPSRWTRTANEAERSAAIESAPAEKTAPAATATKAQLNGAEEQLRETMAELDRMKQERNALKEGLKVAQASESEDCKVSQKKAEALVKMMFEDGALDWELLEDTALAGQYVWAWREESYLEEQQEVPQPGSHIIYNPQVWKNIEARYLAWIVSGQSKPYRFVEVDVGGENCFYDYETVDLRRMEQRSSMAAHGHVSTPSPALPRSLQRLAISTLTEAQRADHEQRLQREILEKEAAIAQKARAAEKAIPMKLVLKTPVLDEDGRGHTLGSRQGDVAMTAPPAVYREEDLTAFIQRLVE